MWWRSVNAWDAFLSTDHSSPDLELTNSPPQGHPLGWSVLTQPYLMKIWMCPRCLLVVCCLCHRLWSIISLSGMCTWGWLWSWARCPFSSVLLSFGFSGKGLLHKMRPSQPTGREAPVGQRAEKIILSIVTGSFSQLTGQKRRPDFRKTEISTVILPSEWCSRQKPIISEAVS